MRTRLLVLPLMMLAFVAFNPGAGAQEAIGNSDAPPPESCTLHPRTIDDLRQIAESPIAATPVPIPIASPFAMPRGDELFDRELTEVEKDLRRAIACVNTGEPLKALAAYTDRWVRDFIDKQGGLTETVITALSTPRNIDPREYLRVLGFGNSVLLEDKRIAIVVLGDDPTDEVPPGERLFILSEVQPGRYLIDDVIEIDGK